MSASSASAAAIVFEPEFLAGLTTIFEEKIVFNQLLGLKVTSIAPQQVVARIDMRPELVGHYAYNRIHGGVISAGLDAMGGLAVMAAIGAKHMDEPPSSACTALPSWAPSTCAWTTCAPALAATSSCAPRCCAWARAWPPRAWNSWALTGSSCRPGRRLTSFLRALRCAAGGGLCVLQALQAHATNEPFGYCFCGTMATFAGMKT